MMAPATAARLDRALFQIAAQILNHRVDGRVALLRIVTQRTQHDRVEITA